jgi:integrase
MSNPSRESPVIVKGYRKGMRAPNKNRKYPPTRLEPDEVIAILDTCGRGSTGLRQRAIIGILYRTGIEPAEVTDLRLGDLDLAPDAESVQVGGGRLRRRTLALDAFAMETLTPWLDRRPKFSGDFLFCTTETGRDGSPIGHAYLREFLRERGRRVGIERLHPNAFRHTLAAELLVEGWPLPYMQAQLGIRTLGALQTLLDHLKIRTPPDSEVMEIVRARPPAFGTP